MNALLAILLLLSAQDASDSSTLREMVDLVNRGAAPDLQARLEAKALAIRDAELRAKARQAVDEMVTAAALHPRVEAIVKELSAAGAKTTLETGGPAWMREIAGGGAPSPFDRLVGLSLYMNVNAHAKDYKLNTTFGDSWLERLKGLPHLRSLNLENTDVKGPGLVFVGTLSTLESLNLTLCPVTDEPLAPIGELTRLKVMGLASTRVTGTGFRSLQNLKSLENLNLHCAPVNDAGLEWIGKMSSLLRLEIVHTQFTDAGAGALAGLVNLERLQLGSRKATGASLAVLPSCPKLREADIHDGLLTLEGFRHVAGVKTLKLLRGYGGNAGDGGLKALAGHPELESLHLEGVGITDEGLPHLAALPRLRKVFLREPKVSEQALRQLQEKLPSVEIRR
jgi:hypothetical protein